MSYYNYYYPSYYNYYYPVTYSWPNPSTYYSTTTSVTAGTSGFYTITIAPPPKKKEISKVCIKCTTARTRHADADNLASDELCWSCLNSK